MMRLIVVFCVLASIADASPFRTKPRIVGGQDATLGQFPWQISLRAQGMHNCGGTILNNKWIVTAAHCLEGWSIEYLSVAVGTITLNDPEARVYEIAEAIIHAAWDQWDFHNDIALIRVAEDIEYNDNVQPCALNTDDIGADVDLVLTGWGRTSYPGNLAETLQMINLRSISNEQCQVGQPWLPIVASEICTAGVEGQGACHGDSGGPLIYNGTLCGIVSYGTPCAQGDPDVFTRVSSFVDWINERIN